MASYLRLVSPESEAIDGLSRILVVSDAITATQYISFLQPLQSSVESGRIRLFFADCPKTQAAADALFEETAPDCLVLSRCTLPGGEPLVKLARQNAIPYVYHIDDDLLRVPQSLGADKFKAYNNPSRLKRLTDYMNNADLVYASTEALRLALRESSITSTIESGYVYCAVDPDQLLQPMISPSPIIGYMGTSGHYNDLLMILPAIERLMVENPALRFELFGTIQMPGSLERFGSRVQMHAPDLNYSGFIRKLHGLGWWIGLAPLEDNSFNRCKADTKWVEYASAGIAVVASDMPVYHRACANGSGVLVAEDGDWHGAIQALLLDASRRRRMTGLASAKLRHDYHLDTLNSQVLRVLERARGIAAARG